MNSSLLNRTSEWEVDPVLLLLSAGWAILYPQAVHDALRCLRCIFSTKNSDDSYMPSSGSVSSSSSDMPQPLAPQTTCNDKESEDLAIQLKEAVATAELLEGAIKSILSSFDLYTEKYDRYINRYLILQRDIFKEKLFTLTATRIRLNTYGLVIHLALGNAIWRNYPSRALWNLRNFNAVNVTYSATPFLCASVGKKNNVLG